MNERRRLAVAIAIPGLAIAVMLFAPISSNVTAGSSSTSQDGALAWLLPKDRPAASGIGTVQVTTQRPAVADTYDWVDLLRIGEITYTTALLNKGRDLRQEDLGSEIARVGRKLDGTVKPLDYVMQDGDAAYLDPGTPIYSVQGYATSFRLAALRSGRPVLFEAVINPAAKVGRDLLDIDGKVRSISIDVTVPGAGARSIDRAEDVSALVRMVLDARIDRSQPFGRRTAYVSFRLLDGTAVTFAYSADTAMLSHGIVGLPPQLRALIGSP